MNMQCGGGAILSDRSTSVVLATIRGVDRPAPYSENRFLGDKRSQVFYDLDKMSDESVVDELIASGQATTFGPDTEAEARNRGYRIRHI